MLAWLTGRRTIIVAHTHTAAAHRAYSIVTERPSETFELQDPMAAVIDFSWHHQTLQREWKHQETFWISGLLAGGSPGFRIVLCCFFYSQISSMAMFVFGCLFIFVLPPYQYYG